MSANFTPGPWYVRDLSARAMRKLGWTGPSIDSILITNKSDPEIIRDEGEDAVIARIEFKHRPEELGEGNLADANLIAAAPDLYEAGAALIADVRQRYPGEELRCELMRALEAALTKAQGIHPEGTGNG